jgi:RNA polymerase sigma-70 factor (ECF subfamily)
MTAGDSLAARFEADRARLRSVAYRMLGSPSEADDAVQEAWLKISQSDTDAVDNLGGWLTTVVARVCLDMLRSRKARREDPIAAHPPAAIEERPDEIDLERDAMLSDSVGLAMTIVLDKLTPAERVAFVLHDMFDLPFEDIARIVGRSPAATRQLASRGRRRVQGAPANFDGDADRTRQREVVDAFLAASRGGDFEGLLAVLDPEVVLRADAVLVEHQWEDAGGGTPRFEKEMRGAATIAKMFSGRAKAARPALIDGDIGLVIAPTGTPRVALAFTIEGGGILEIEMIAEPERLRDFEVTMLDR